MSQQVAANPYKGPAMMKGAYVQRALYRLYGCFVLAGFSALAYRRYVMEPRMALFKEYYENYDVEKEYKFLKEQGVYWGFEKE